MSARFSYQKGSISNLYPLPNRAVVKFSCATQTVSLESPVANVPDAGPGTHALLGWPIVWLSPPQCGLYFPGETYSIGPEASAAGRHLAGAGAAQPGSKCSVHLEERPRPPGACGPALGRPLGPLCAGRGRRDRPLLFHVQGSPPTPLCPFIPSGSGLNRRHSARLFLSTLCLTNQ